MKKVSWLQKEIESVSQLKEIEALRNLYRERYFNEKYSGWRDDFDRGFDKHSEWLINKNSSAFCRVTRKEVNSLLPLESGSSGYQLPINSSVCEINNFFHNDHRTAMRFMGSVFLRLNEIGIENTLCVVDAENKTALKLNIKYFKFSFANEVLTFSDVKHNDRGSLVRWQILFQDQCARDSAISLLMTK